MNHPRPALLTLLLASLLCLAAPVHAQDDSNEPAPAVDAEEDGEGAPADDDETPDNKGENDGEGDSEGESDEGAAAEDREAGEGEEDAEGGEAAQGAETPQGDGEGAEDDGEVVELGDDGEVVELGDDGEVVEVGEDGEVVEVGEDGEVVEEVKEDEKGVVKVAPVVVTATPEELARIGGSASSMDEEDLEEFEYDDAHSMLMQFSGLYTRQEDAFGLRPNIGLRGANSDRSKKVTLMEDGVLVGPAPYSAPAAYFFPLMTRMTGLEVYKGPASVKYGPQTIGGAINMISRDIPYDLEGGVDLAYGMFNSGKLHLHVGQSAPWGGFLIEGVHLQSDGFKELDGGGDTGFSKSEVVAKGQINSALDGETFHRLRLRLGFARELSHETYLGLSDADFDDNPYRRYRASALGRMSWWRTEGRLTYRMDMGQHADITMDLYRHDFTRAWRKLNRFLDGPSLEEILADPTNGRRRVFYDVLTGATDSTEAETLQIGTNDRSYVSQGWQTAARFEMGAPGKDGELGWSSEWTFGLRIHHDNIERNHTEDSYFMEAGELVLAGTPRLTTTRNRGEAVALATYVHNVTTLGRLTLAPGARFELIHTALLDRPSGLLASGTQSAFLPGLGLHYALTPELGVLAGVHRGFSPVSPGQPDEVEPEFSVNYELGARYFIADTGTLAEVIGFLNDYSNLTGECSFSSGCNEAQLDQQFNAGEALVYGAEAVVDHDFELGVAGLSIPVRVAYTLTMTRFESAFISENPQLGVVEEGDRLPYVPQHQASARVGLKHEVAGVSVNTTFVDEMFEQSGKPGDEDLVVSDRFVMVDVATFYNFYSDPTWGDLQLYAKADNVLNVQPVASRRPFGARPARPFLAQVGLKLDF